MMDPVKDDIDIEMEYMALGKHESTAERNNQTLQE